MFVPDYQFAEIRNKTTTRNWITWALVICSSYPLISLGQTDAVDHPERLRKGRNTVSQSDPRVDLSVAPGQAVYQEIKIQSLKRQFGT